MEIKVLGACCKKSLQTFENTKIAVLQLGLDSVVENVGDIDEIAGYGVLATPALVIDGQVMSFGRLLKPTDVIKFLEAIMKKGQ